MGHLCLVKNGWTKMWIGIIMNPSQFKGHTMASSKWILVFDYGMKCEWTKIGLEELYKWREFSLGILSKIKAG